MGLAVPNVFRQKPYFWLLLFGGVPSTASTTDGTASGPGRVGRRRAVSPVLSAETATVVARGFSQKVEHFDVSELATPAGHRSRQGPRKKAGEELRALQWNLFLSTPKPRPPPPHT